jgi:predicted Zn-dependent peptidase
MVRRSELSNGLRVLSEPMPGVSSTTVGIWVENGSRFENRQQGGISHFLEHLLFKGTARRTAAQIAEEMDAVGGVLNAFTGKEYTCYYARVLAEHFDLAADILADLFLNSTFDPEEIERERTVVLQEISQGEDNPDHPLSFPICGTSETVSSFQRDDFLSFLAERYRPDRIVVAAAGDIRHEALEEWGQNAFGSMQGKADGTGDAAPKEQKGVFAVEKPLEQVHLCLGVPGIRQTAPERFAAHLLNTALGGGMSSRLFQEIRERRGRAYSVYSFLSSYADAGYLGVYVGTSSEFIEEVVQVILTELRSLAEAGLRPDELARAKNQLKGSMLLGLETSDARMSRLAKSELFFRRDISPSEIAAHIDATSNDEILQLAEQLFCPDRTAVALLGNFDGMRPDDSILS